LIQGTTVARREQRDLHVKIDLHSPYFLQDSSVISRYV
jgi:hypothetical protein